MINLDEMNPLPERMELLRQRQTMNKIRCAAPGIVQAYDAGQQTVTVQLAVREWLNDDGKETWADIPLLLGITIFSAVFVFTGNMIANILYPVIDPRIREGGRL